MGGVGMRDDDDFASYMHARWTSMVRSLVMLGCSRHEAEDVAQSALIRCYVAWDRVAAAEDRDAYTYRLLLNTWASSRRRRWWGERPTAKTTEVSASDPSPSVDLRMALAQALGGLSVQHREVLVLRFVADLSEIQVATVLGIPAGTVKSRVARAIARVDTEDLRRAIS